MKVRVAYTTEVSDDYRRAINNYYGKPGLATREEVRRWLEAHGSSEDDNLMWELDQKEVAGGH
jgi:hypothetical protein